MKRASLLFIAVVNTMYFCGAQNLIPNESFEEVNEISNNWIPNDGLFEERMEEWVTPNQGSPDIFFDKIVSKMSPVRKGVDLSGHAPRTGHMMVGIKTYGCETFTQHCKEYIQVKLKAPIVKGQTYYIEFYALSYVNGIYTSNLGMAFAESEVQDDSEYGLYYLEPTIVEDRIISGGKNQWHKIADTIEAAGNYEYVLIGNFIQDADTKTFKDKATIDYGYYLLDDVSVQAVSNSFNSEFNSENVEPGKAVVLENIFFETGKATLQPNSFVELDELTQFMKQNAALRIQIIGHTDNEGEGHDNYQLSEHRAHAVLEYLSKKGIVMDRLDYVGYGEDRPVAGNDTEAGRAMNRRVEFVVLE